MSAIVYRRFLNTDPPHLSRIWNQSMNGRATYPVHSSAPFDRWLFSKPYFDPEGLIVAVSDNIPIGFAHAGFASNSQQTGLNHQIGITCLLVIQPEYRRKGIGKTLLEKSEEYLKQKGATKIFAGSQRPFQPFYFGLYGGCDSPGFLIGDGDASPFFVSQGYQLVRSVQVYQKPLDNPINIVDPRFANLRRRFDIGVAPLDRRFTWWEECVYGQIEPEPIEFRLIERKSQEVVGRTILWEMEGFSRRWNTIAAGILSIRILTNYQRQGLGQFLLAHLLRFLQEHFIRLVEIHNPEENLAGEKFLRSLDFQLVDTGYLFQKSTNPPMNPMLLS